MAAVGTPMHSDGADDERDEDASDIEHDPNAQNGERAASPVEPTDYSLFDNPPDLAATRQRLFDITETIEMSPTDFEQYFPYVDNVWRKTKTAAEDIVPGVNTEVYWCRLRKALGLKPHIPKPTPEGKTPRKKREKPDKTCNMALKITYSDGPVKKVIVTRNVPETEEHTHDLDYIDTVKRNGAIMDVARREATRSFLPTSIFWKMQQEPDRMEEAGGKHMKVSDVRNVQYAWRQENPNVPLKAHSGFSTTRAGYTGKSATRRLSLEQVKPSPAPEPNAPNKPHSPGLPASPQPGRGSQPAPTAQVQPPYQRPAQMSPPRSSGPLQPPSSQIAASTNSPAYAPQHPVPPSPLPADTLQYPDHARTFLYPYLPDGRTVQARQRPHVTLTYAASLDGRIAIFPSQRTALSGPESKSMTHFLRSCHSAILVGVRTAIADNPALNCRLTGAAGYGAQRHSGYMQPRPIIIDPNARLHIQADMAMLKAVNEGRAKAPWIVVSPTARLHPTAVSVLKAYGGEYLQIHDYNPQAGGFSWEIIFNVLFREGIQSIMVEGGGLILSELLQPTYAHLIDSVITTISPQFLGQQGVQVSHPSCVDDHGRLVPAKLKDVRWQPMGDEDVVMCGRPKPPLSSQVRQMYPMQAESQVPTSAFQHPPQHQQHYAPAQAEQRPGTANGILEGIEEIAKSAPSNGHGEVNGHPLQRPPESPHQVRSPESKKRKTGPA